MSRGKQWSPKMDSILEKWYADEESTKLAAQFGYGVRTIERHAAQLGLKKSPELLKRVAKKASDAATRWIDGKKARGEKIEKRWGGHGFQKGHQWDEETEKRRVEGIRGAGRKKNLEKKTEMSKFAPSELKKMRTVDLEAMLKEEMEKVLRLRKELDRRKGEKLESEKADGVFFESYVTE